VYHTQILNTRYSSRCSSGVSLWNTSFLCSNRGSSVSIVSDYGLDGRSNQVRSPVDAKDLSSNLWVQTGSEAHPASCTMGTGGPFPGLKRGQGVTLTTQPYLVLRSWMSRSYTSSPLRLHRCVVGLLYICLCSIQVPCQRRSPQLGTEGMTMSCLVRAMAHLMERR
jgi:hypothetical protein